MSQLRYRLRYAAYSDVGRVRQDNQDSGYAGPYMLAVADGVGGAARGDIASHSAIAELRKLDQPYDSPDQPLRVIAGALSKIHDRIADLVEEHPEIDGTSTTVTAGVFTGDGLALGHIGDSRAYLLRGSNLQQITHDHTFVQTLVDEGRITEDEARTHPHRNLILQAVDGVREPDPDLTVIELRLGDRLLFCSDGASGPFSTAQLAELIADGSPESVAVTLVRAAMDAGSTDNVTALVGDVVDTPAGPDEAASTTGPMLVGAAATQPRFEPLEVPTAPDDTGELDPVEDNELIQRVEDEDEALRYAPQPPKRFTWLRRLIVIAVVGVLVWLLGSAAYAWTQTQYYVGNDGQNVVIFRGVKADVPGLTMHRVDSRTALTLDELSNFSQRQVTDGIGASDLADARNIVKRLTENRVCIPASEASASATPSTSPSASKSGKATATPSTSSAPTKTGTKAAPKTKASATASPTSPTTPVCAP